MKKRKGIMSVIFILLFAVGISSGNTLFTKDEAGTLENWNKNKAAKSIGEPEAYSEPESATKPKSGSRNTLFTEDEWNMLENWKKNNQKMGEPEVYIEPETERK